MRKLIVATTLTVVLAGSASAADTRFQDRSPRDRDTVIARVMKAVKRLLVPTTNTTPSTPVPTKD